jgi:predicted GNAT family N-acyltransferase
VKAEPEIRPARGAEEYEAALRVRVAVFVDEQGGPLSDEPDRWDAAARHWVVISDGEIVGTARLYEPEKGTGKIGRVALLPGYRGRGWGMLLMRELISAAETAAFNGVVLDAQTYALAFYERLGFHPEGETFMDAGIPHQRMRLGGR